ncbi:auxin response factor 18-like [Solanum pennellii]|uniref:Auxin response factor n=1 Tax=Solanum pennellii TaxID=28526 RepID=A0ABM1FCW4_SOLPN|nr:auxin response factor 18-like [Solanum pennellii]
MADNKSNCFDSRLWQACAGTIVKMPAVNSIVLYFPQGHAEHAGVNVEFRSDVKIPSYIPCRVLSIKYMAERETDEVFAKIRLTPVRLSEFFETADEGMVKIGSDNSRKPLSFAKTLTQSDANNGGGFSVPKNCADTIFPTLDYNVNPPVQTLSATDIHGKSWQFRHIYRGTPERHLLTTGWSTFVNEKKLVAGDSIVFLRNENDKISIGIRRIKKKSVAIEPETSPWWFPSVGNLTIPRGGFSAFLRDDQNTNSSWSLINRGNVKAESVIEATKLATNGQPFEVIFYPRSTTPEFFVKASRVKAALQIPWCSGMRFKMPFETEDLVISWFMGTISSVQANDPSQWPDSPWRMLQVTWDEPNLLHNVMCVNPWLVEPVSNMPTINFNPYTPPLKKLRLSHTSDFPLNGPLPMSGFPNNHLEFSIDPPMPNGCLPNNTPVGMQGARHAPYNLSLPDIHTNNLLSSLSPVGFPSLYHVVASPSTSNNTMIPKPSKNADISSLLTLGSSTQTIKKFDSEKTTQFVLFGQPIVIEQQTSQSNSRISVSPRHATNSFSDGNEYKKENTSDSSDTSFVHNSVQHYLPSQSFRSEENVEIGHSKVFIESEDIGQTKQLGEW